MENNLQKELNKALNRFKEDWQSSIVSDTLFQKLIEYWKSLLIDEKSPLYNNFFHFFLYRESINCGIVLSFLYTKKDGKVLEKNGILTEHIEELQTEINKEIDENKTEDIFTIVLENTNLEILKNLKQKKLYLLTENFRHRINHKISPEHPASGKDLVLAHLLWNNNKNCISNINRMYKNYSVNYHFKEENNTINFFSYLEKDFRRLLQANKGNPNPLQINIFQFQKFNNYFHLIGEFFARSIIDEISIKITERLKKEDSYYQISPRIHLSISPNCTKEIIRERFKNIFFQINGIILAYKLKSYEVHQEEDLEKVFREIFPARK